MKKFGMYTQYYLATQNKEMQSFAANIDEDGAHQLK